MADDIYHRFRLTVPKDDVSVIKWIKQQSNLSVSLRMLIGDTIEQVGFKDYTCRERVPAGGAPVRKVRAAAAPVQVPVPEAVVETVVDASIRQPVVNQPVQVTPAPVPAPAPAPTPTSAPAPAPAPAPALHQPSVTPVRPTQHTPSGNVPAGHVPDDDEIMRMFG